MKRCFFIGHRDTPDSVLPVLTSAIENLIQQYGVKEFLVGHHGQFDRLVAIALADAQKKHPSIRLLLLIPYHPALHPVTLPVEFHGSVYPPDMERVPLCYAIVRANHYAVDHSDFLIAWVRYSPSNAAKLVEYAQKKAHCYVLTI